MAGLGAGGARWLGRVGRRGGVQGWRKVLGGVGKGAAMASLRWRAVAGGAEELWWRWLGLGHGGVWGKVKKNS